LPGKKKLGLQNRSGYTISLDKIKKTPNHVFTVLTSTKGSKSETIDQLCEQYCKWEFLFFRSMQDERNAMKV